MRKEKIYPAYVSKNNWNREKQVILLTSQNGKGWRWRYTAAKKFPASLREVKSKNNGDFYFLNCFHSFKIKTKFGSHKNVCKNNVTIWFLETLKYLNLINIKSVMKAPVIIYEDLEWKIEKTGCTNNSENLSTTKVSEHILSGFSMYTISSFRGIENKHDVHRA